jgi:hypothetical protein
MSTVAVVGEQPFIELSPLGFRFVSVSGDAKPEEQLRGDVKGCVSPLQTQQPEPKVNSVTASHTEHARSQYTQMKPPETANALHHSAHQLGTGSRWRPLRLKIAQETGPGRLQGAKLCCHPTQ